MRTLLAVFLVLPGSFAAAVELPTTEAGVVEYLAAKGVRIGKDADGRAVRLMSSGKPALTVDEYQLIGLLTRLEQVGLNAAPLKEGEWGFLRKLPRLKTLSIWHGHAFATLEPFSGLKVESLTIGGCMGLRDLNKGDADKLRNAVLTLEDLPNVKRARLYHSPLLPDDRHLAHLVEQAPRLESLNIDLAAPRDSETNVTPEGLAVLAKLPLVELGIENAKSLGPDHFAAIAKIKTLDALLVDARRQPVSDAGLARFRELRPDVEIVVAGPEAKGPPRASRKRPPR